MKTVDAGERASLHKSGETPPPPWRARAAFTQLRPGFVARGADTAAHSGAEVEEEGGMEEGKREVGGGA